MLLNDFLYYINACCKRRALGRSVCGTSLSFAFILFQILIMSYLTRLKMIIHETFFFWYILCMKTFKNDFFFLASSHRICHRPPCLNILSTHFETGEKISLLIFLTNFTLLTCWSLAIFLYFHEILSNIFYQIFCIDVKSFSNKSYI